MTKLLLAVNLRCLLGFAMTLTLGAPISADDRVEQVHFAKGTSSKIIKGSIKGYDGIKYMVGAKAGQIMTVSLKSSNGANLFNIWAPGKTPGNDAALFAGDTGGNEAKIKLPADGDYAVQIYLMRSVARRNTLVNYTLTIEVSPDNK